MKLFFLVALLSTASAQAAVTGSWIGFGEWQFEGQGPDCNMIIGFRESETELKRLGGTFDCGVVVLHSDPLAWQKQGTELFLDGARAGEFTENGFTSIEPVNDEGAVAYTKFLRNGNSADYEERWVGKDGKEIYLIKGRLFLQER